jgi:hypothetical protein
MSDDDEISNDDDKDDDYALTTRVMVETGTPQTFAEAISGPKGPAWWASMSKEYNSHKEKGTFILVIRQKHMNVMRHKWVYKIKRNEKGEVTELKSRITPKGFMQVYGIDYKETFAPVMRYPSMRILFAEAARRDWEIKQGDVSAAFLNADVEEELYMEQPAGFEQYGPNGEEMVWKLKKSVYGIKQAPRNWYKRLRRSMEEKKLTPCKSEPSVYVHRTASGRMLYMAVWVDDIWAFYDKRDEAAFKTIEAGLLADFKMKAFDDVRSVLGIRVQRDRARRTLTLDQETHASDLLKKLGMEHCKPIKTPMVDKDISRRQAPATEAERGAMSSVPYRDGVGSLMWLAGQTRPDIAFPVGVLARFMSDPGQAHWESMKRVLRYVRGTTDARLVYKAHGGRQGEEQAAVSVLEAYSDADWASDVDGRRSTTGYMVMLNGNLVAWSSKKQPTVALSTAEAEYMGMSAATEELLWVRQFLGELGIPVGRPMVLRTDNQAAQTIANGEVSTQRTKHIDIRHHFVREQAAAKELEIKWVPTQEQLADLLTKSLGTTPFRELRRRVMACNDDWQARRW